MNDKKLILELLFDEDSDHRQTRVFYCARLAELLAVERFITHTVLKQALSKDNADLIIKTIDSSVNNINIFNEFFNYMQMQLNGYSRIN